MRHLDPTCYLVFKKVFGEHSDILRSFLNALLPFSEDEKIASLEYLDPESVPPIPTFNYSIVNVRCRSVRGSEFIVKVQLQWTTTFLKRVRFDGQRAYASQLDFPRDFGLAQPVFGLTILDDIFNNGNSEFYHHYKMVNIEGVEQEVKGLQLMFIELPKFKESQSENPHLVAWLRYLREIGKAKAYDESLATVSPELNEAMKLAEASAYTPAEMNAYHKYGDMVSTERMMLSDKLEEGLIKGREEGLAIAFEKLVGTGMSPEAARGLLGIAQAD